MSPYILTGLLLLAVLATVIFAFVFTSRRAKPVLDSDDLYSDLADEIFERATAGDGYHRRNMSFERIEQDRTLTGGKPPARKARDLDEPFRRTAENVRLHPPVEAKYHPRPSFVPQTVHPTITLTPRQIERVNIQRKLRGKPPFNRNGLTNAIAHPWDRAGMRQPQSSNDWLSYLIAYEIFAADHQGHTIAGCGGVTIDTGQPYNGHGGEYAGAGASGDWSNNMTRSEAAAIEHGIPMTTDAPAGTGGFAPLPPATDPLSDPASFKGPDPSPAATYAPDPSPAATYSVPDPSPSFDSSSSFSAPDTSSSSSSF